mgnify:CR=1 FL=1
MKKLIVTIIVGMLLSASFANAAPNYGSVPAPGPTLIPSPGPAPNSGDGISDGSGFEEDFSLFDVVSGIFFGPGPAPNAGDGVSDGSGFETPPKGLK